MVQWRSENQHQTFFALELFPINLTQHTEAETALYTAEYVIESHVIGHIKAPHQQEAKDK